MANEYSGFAALGDLVAGGPARRSEGEFFKGVKESATAWDALDQAREARARRMARDSLPNLTREAGVPHPELAAALLQMARGQPNLGSVTGGLQDLGEIELERQQVEAMRAGNIRLANQLNAVRADKNYEPVRSVDGNLIPSGVTLGDPDFAIKPLPQTEARVDLLGAQKTKALRPPAARAPLGGGAAPKVEDQELANARAALQAGVPRAKVIEKMRARGFGSLAKKL